MGRGAIPVLNLFPAKTAPQSLSDVLEERLPGIEFTLVDGRQAGITFQGLDASYLMVLVDGHRLAGEIARGNPDLNRVDIDRVGRIDVQRGATGSTRYGSGAVAGVIDILTRPPHANWGIDANARYSSAGEQHYSLGVSRGGRLTTATSAIFRDKQRYFLDSRGSFSGGHAGAAPVPGEVRERVEIEGFQNYSVRQQLAYDLSDALHASAYGEYYHHERRNAGEVGKRRHDLYRDIAGGAKLDWQLAGRQDLEFAYDFDSYTKLDKYLLLERTERNYRHTLHNPKLFYAGHSGDLSVQGGAELIAEQLATYQFADGQGTHRRDTWAAFAQADWNLGDFGVQAGLRGERHASFGAHLTERISASYRLGDLTLRAGYASAFRAPTLKELHTDWDHQGLFQMVGNADLKPETSHNFEASADYAHRRISLSISAFHNRISDKIATTWNAAGDTLRYANASSARVTGVNVSGKWHWRRWGLGTSYAYTHDYQRIDGKNTSSVRPHSATTQLDYRLRDWTIGLSGRWRGGIDQWVATASGDWVKLRYPAYAILKLSAGGPLSRNIRLTAGIDNLLDYTPRHVTFNAGITPGISAFLALNFEL